MEILGDYWVGPRIATGGMAVIHAAYRPTGGGRLVALKRMSGARLSDPAARRRFLREASIVMRIEHPNVVRTYEVGEADGDVYIAMELLEGATLSELQRASKPRLPLPLTLYVVTSALRGLHAAHELRAPDGEPLGLVHQDVSPPNIHVAYEGTARILDFGVARLLAEDGSRSDTVSGKACYLAPEQLNCGKLTCQVDVFAMGIVLHEALTGLPLFPRQGPEVAYSAILSGAVPTPSALCPNIPCEIDAVVRRALSVDPSERYPSAAEMRCALLAAQACAGIPTIDVADVAAWVSKIATTAWTKVDLERDFHEALTRPVIARADLTTLDPRRISGSRHTRGASTYRRFAGRLALLASVAVGSFVVGSGLHRPATADNGVAARLRNLTRKDGDRPAPEGALTSRPPESPLPMIAQVPSAAVTPAAPSAGHRVTRDKPRPPASSPPAPAIPPRDDDPLATQ